MMSRNLEMKKSLNAELSSSESPVAPLTYQEWTLTSGYVEVLRPLQEATEQTCLETQPTLSMVIPILWSLQANCKEYLQNPRNPGIALARKVHQYMLSIFPNLMKNEMPYMLAMAMDPRFKHIVLDPFERSKLRDDVIRNCIPIIQHEAEQAPTGMLNSKRLERIS